MKKDKIQNLSFDRCGELFAARKRVLNSSIKLENNTYLVRRKNDDNSVRSYGVVLHATKIITFFPDGSIEIRTGGWFTRLTMGRLQQYLPKNVVIYRNYSNRKERIYVVELSESTDEFNEEIMNQYHNPDCTWTYEEYTAKAMKNHIIIPFEEGITIFPETIKNYKQELTRLTA